MTVLNRIEPRKLMCAGVVLMAVRSVAQMTLERRGGANDVTDFFLGLLFGVGAAIALIGIWRNSRGGRSSSRGA